MERPEKLIIEGAEILYPNFSGEKGQFKGNRNFSIIIAPEQAEALREAGWYIKHEDGNEYHNERYYLTVNLRYSDDNPSRNPRVHLVTDKAVVQLDQKSVANLDEVWIESVDAVINASKESRMKPDGKLGFGAYANIVYAKSNGKRKASSGDPFADKYAKCNSISNPGLAIESDELPF